MRSRITGPANAYIYICIYMNIGTRSRTCIICIIIISSYNFFSSSLIIRAAHIKYRRRVFAQFASSYKNFGTAAREKQRVHYERETAPPATLVAPIPIYISPPTTVCFKIKKKDRFVFIRPRSVLHAIIIIRLETCEKKK